MNEFDDIDRELEAVFTQRPSTLSRPSLRDVKQRARRHQRQRSAGVLSACALVGVGAVAVVAQRSPSNQTTNGGFEGDPTTTSCFPATSIPGTTIGVEYVADTEPSSSSAILTFYTVQAGDNPTTIANAFGVTLEELNAANAETPGYRESVVGTEIAIPVTAATTTTLSADDGTGIAGTYTLEAGDFPGSVAEKFKVTVAELDAVNRDVNGYGSFAVGTLINIPFPHVESTTTYDGTLLGTTTTSYTPVDPMPIVGNPCSQIPTPMYRCMGESVVYATDDGWRYFDYCETLSYNGEPSVPTTITFTKVGAGVQVVNTSNQEGAAGFLADALAAEGFTMVEPDTGTIDMPVTKVIYNPDDPAALPVAQSLALYLGNATVEASGPVVPTLTLGTWAPGSSVIVLLGDDLAGKTLAEIAGQSSAATSTTCIMQPQMTLPPPAATTSLYGYC